jgi:hypothetical protein
MTLENSVWDPVGAPVGAVWDYVGCSAHSAVHGSVWFYVRTSIVVSMRDPAVDAFVYSHISKKINERL